jgi:serine/threonine protein kinase
MNNLPQIKSPKGKVYTVLKVLGQGQYGKVYLVVDEQGCNFAMKSVAYEHFQMDSKKIQNLVTEQNIMEIVNSPRILKLYDKIDNGKVIHLITTYCDGGNLEEVVLKNKKGLGEKLSRNFIVQIGEAFYEMRKNRIIHRDLKLANIFLNKGSVVIGDFGFAKLGVSMTGSKLGTPYYMAPEILNQTSNSSKYTSKCDLWSIGVCYYFLIFGILPFDANSLGELKSKIEKNSGDKIPFPKTEEISVESKRLLAGLLQKHPDQRWTFDKFFEFCGLKPLNDADAKSINSNRDMELESEMNEISLAQRQMNNFGNQINALGLECLSRTSQTKSNELLSVYEQGQARSMVNKTVSVQDLNYFHQATPINTSSVNQRDPTNNKNRGKFSISRMNESFAEDESYGYICFKTNQNLPEADPYIFKVNQIVYFFNVLKKIKDSRVSSNTFIRKSDFNALLVNIELFTARKAEIFIKEFKKIVIGKINAFNIKTFGFFCNSKVYGDIWQVVLEFEAFIGDVYDILRQEIEKEAPKLSEEMAKIRQIDTIQVEKNIKNQCKLLWRAFSKNLSNLSVSEKSDILHIIVYLIYFCQDNLFPQDKFLTQKEWTKFNVFIDKRTDAEIEIEINQIFS